MPGLPSEPFPTGCPDLAPLPPADPLPAIGSHLLPPLPPDLPPDPPDLPPDPPPIIRAAEAPPPPPPPRLHLPSTAKRVPPLPLSLPHATAEPAFMTFTLASPPRPAAVNIPLPAPLLPLPPKTGVPAVHELHKDLPLLVGPTSASDAEQRQQVHCTACFSMSAIAHRGHLKIITA